MRRLASVFLLTAALAACRTPQETGSALRDDDDDEGSPKGLVDAHRETAAKMIEALQDPADGGVTLSAPPEVVDWLLDNQAPLAADVRAAPHTWTDAFPSSCPAATCACTGSAPGDAVYLSPSRCSEINGRNAAILIMIHEAIHHFGVGNAPAQEEFASDGAHAVVEAWVKSGLDALPQSFRYDEVKRRCVDAFGAEGYNDGYFGDCGREVDQVVGKKNFRDLTRRSHLEDFDDDPDRLLMRGGRYGGSDFTGSTFALVNLSDAVFDGAILHDVRTNLGRWHRASLRGATTS